MNQKLDAPPIIEVMCGFFFEPVAGLDPIAVGGWWRSIKAEFPTHQVQPAVADPGTIVFGDGAGPLRTWLVSADDEWVLQVQADRFYVNWRKRRGPYPRFRGEEGVLDRSLKEFLRFSQYCKEELGASIVATTVEMAKVDLIVEQRHWKDASDLGAILPVVADVSKFAKSPALTLGLNVVEPREGGVLQMGLQLLPEAMIDGKLVRALKLETRASCPVDARPTVADTFQALNEHVNGVFFGLFTAEGVQRFNGPGKT